MTAIGRLLGASIAATVLLLGVAAYAQTTEPPKKAAEPAKKPPKVKSVCNGLPDEAACKANDTCRWIAARKDAKDAKTGKERKAYCRTQAKSTKKKTSTEPEKK